MSGSTLYAYSSSLDKTQNFRIPSTKSWLTHVRILCARIQVDFATYVQTTHAYILRPKTFNRILNYLWIEDFIVALSIRYTCMCVFLWAKENLLLCPLNARP